MVRSSFAGEPALRLVLMRRADEDEILVRVVGVLVPQELEALERPAEGVDLGNHEVRGDDDALALLRCGRGRTDGALARGRRGGGRFRRHGLLRMRGRLRAVLALPSFPKHENGEAENEQQNEALRIHAQGTGS